jgi:predicted transporter
MLLSKLASLFGLLHLVGAVLLPMYSLSTMSYTIRIRGFNLRGSRVPTLLNLAASLLTLAALGVGRGLPLL